MFIGIGILSLIAGSFYWYLMNEKRNPKEATRMSGNAQTSAIGQYFIEVPVVTLIEITDSVPALRYTYTISYPEIALLGHPDHAKQANAVIKTFVLDILDAFKRNLEPEGDGPDTAHVASDLTVQTTASLLSPTILSFRFDYAEYIAGSAHPNQQTRILNYDIEEQKILGTEELFLSPEAALGLLSHYSETALRKKFSDLSEREFQETVLPGVIPMRENFRSVALKKDGLIVIFDPYQVAPYARGTKVLFIPLEDIADMLAPRVREAMTLAETNIREATPEFHSQMETGE